MILVWLRRWRRMRRFDEQVWLRRTCGEGALLPDPEPDQPESKPEPRDELAHARWVATGLHKAWVYAPLDRAPYLRARYLDAIAHLHQVIHTQHTTNEPTVIVARPDPIPAPQNQLRNNAKGARSGHPTPARFADQQQP